MAQKFKLIGYIPRLHMPYNNKLELLMHTVFTDGDGQSCVLDQNNEIWPKEWLLLEPINTIAQLQEQRSDLSAQISELDNKWYEQLVLDDVMNLNDPKQFVMDLCEKLDIDLEIIDERNDEER